MDLRIWLVAGATIFASLLLGIFTGSTLVIQYPDLAYEPIEQSSISSTTPPLPEIKILPPKIQATTTPKQKNASQQAIPVVKPSPPPPTHPEVTQEDLAATAALLRPALINILCSASLPLHSISGSGVVISANGILITNAHIAQYFLLADDPSLGVSCVLRAGSPARNAYHAKLAFISPEWITKNADLLTDSHPVGNGEHDFALLAITESVTEDPLPASFPALPLAGDNAYEGEPVSIGSYAAQFLSSREIQSTLYPTIVFGSVKQLFTFKESTVDVVSLGGSAAAQEGSSGGAVINAQGGLRGVITTSTIEGATSARNLSAITASYIRRDYEASMGAPLTSLLALPSAAAISSFAPKAIELGDLLKAHVR